MSTSYARMTEALEANDAATDATPEAALQAAPAPEPSEPIASSEPITPSEPIAPIAPIASSEPSEPSAPSESSEPIAPERAERALQELDDLRGIVLGSQVGGLAETIARVDAEVTAETRRVREAIEEIDHRLSTRLDSLAVGGDRGRRELAEELVHATREIAESLVKRNEAILTGAEDQFHELRSKLLDSSAFNQLVQQLLSKLAH